MSLWESPVEVFIWKGVISFRDAKKKTMFTIDLGTREYHKVNLYRNEILPKIVELMNGYNFTMTLTDRPMPEDCNPIEALFPPKKRGRPAKIK